MPPLEHTCSATVDAAADSLTVQQLARGFQISAAIHAAVRLGIPDLMARDARTSADLAAASGTNAPALTRLLRTLAAHGFVRETHPDSFVLQDRAATLRADHPHSIRPLVLFWGSDNVWETWVRLADCVRTGRPANGLLTGDDDPNAHRERHPGAAALFHEAMTARVRPIVAALIDTYDFSPYRSVVDIGGGHGYVVTSLLLKFPSLRGIVFDWPTVVAGAVEAITQAGVRNRCDVVGGDLFKGVPSGVDVYLLSGMLQGWDDDRAIRALEIVRDAMTYESRLLVMDFLQPQPGDESAAAKTQVLEDLTMLVRTGGHGRRESELRDLCGTAGLRVTKIQPLGFARSIVEVVRR